MSNILLIVLDAVREDAIASSLEQPGRCLKAQMCAASAPWTLPSCTSIFTGLHPARHGHYWHSTPLIASSLVAAIPPRYKKIGIVNNPVLDVTSGLSAGFDEWIFTRDHKEPFERALRFIRRARRRKPLFLVLHTNIAHDYYLPIAQEYYWDTPSGSVGGPYILGKRVHNWSETNASDREAIVRTYAGCVNTMKSRVTAILDTVRERDDFVVAITADHGEGFDYEKGRLHHGGRLHQDVIKVPLYFDLPSKTTTASRSQIEGGLASQLLSSADVLPTLLALSGVDELPTIDGSRIDRMSTQRTLRSEDRRYLYLKTRTRLNYFGRFKNMSGADRELNEEFMREVNDPPVLRSFVRGTQKLVLTSLNITSNGYEKVEIRRRLLRYGDLLLGSPILTTGGTRLLALEHYDLNADPVEEVNLLADATSREDLLVGTDWASEATVPLGDGSEVALPTLLAGAEHVTASGCG